MPHLIFPTSANGLRLTAVIGLDGTTIAGQMAAGRPVPLPVRVRAEIDTGCNVTAVAPSILAQLGASPRRGSTTQTAAGAVPVDLYDISISIPDLSGTGQPAFVLSSSMAMNLVQPIPDVDVLIGLNVLLQFVTVIDGPGLQFSITY